jgi:hypothetical protein
MVGLALGRGRGRQRRGQKGGGGGHRKGSVPTPATTGGGFWGGLTGRVSERGGFSHHPHPPSPPSRWHPHTPRTVPTCGPTTQQGGEHRCRHSGDEKSHTREVCHHDPPPATPGPPATTTCPPLAPPKPLGGRPTHLLPLALRKCKVMCCLRMPYEQDPLHVWRPIHVSPGLTRGPQQKRCAACSCQFNLHDDAAALAGCLGLLLLLRS